MFDLYKFQPDLERLKLMVKVKQNKQTNKNPQENKQTIKQYINLKPNNEWSQWLYFRISKSRTNLHCNYFHIFPLPEQIH